MILILEQMTKPRGLPSVSPEVRFLAMLMMRKPASLRQADIERLADAMIDWHGRLV